MSKIKSFQCWNRNLERCKDSMAHNSGEIIASGIYADGIHPTVSIDLVVAGDVAVIFDGSKYKNWDQFPDVLKAHILKYPCTWEIENNDPFFNEHQVEIIESNWFEYIYKYNGFVDGALCENDISTYTPDMLKKEMEHIGDWVVQGKSEAEKMIETSEAEKQEEPALAKMIIAAYRENHEKLVEMEAILENGGTLSNGLCEPGCISETYEQGYEDALQMVAEMLGIEL